MINFINKVKKYFNKVIFRTPGLEFFQKNKDIEIRTKYLNFWFNKVKNKKNFKRFFLDNDSSQDELPLRFTQNETYDISEKMLDSLAFNGIIVIENALPKNEFLKIKEYFEDLKNGKYKMEWKNKPDNPLFFSQADEVRGLIEIESFLSLKKYSDYISKKIYGKSIKPTVEFHYLNIRDNIEVATKGATYLHTDRFLPHFKIFYTPNKIESDTAPFQYSLGSHKLNSTYFDFFKNGENFDETDKFSKDLLGKLETITTQENTMYVAFTNGLHKRTCFTEKNKERSMVFLQYVERYNKFNYLF